MVERDFSGFDIRVWQTDSIPADVFEQVKGVFAENYREANLAYLEKNAGKLRFMTTANDLSSGRMAGFALGECRVIDLPRLPASVVNLAGLCCVSPDYRRHGLFGRLEGHVTIEEGNTSDQLETDREVLERAYRDLGFDMTTEITALEAGLDHFIDFGKDFRGRAALERQKAEGLRQRLVTLSLDLGDANALGDETIFHDGKMVGRITSAGWSWQFAKGLALGLVDPAFCKEGTELSISVLDAQRRATVIADSPYDPNHSRCRS